MLNEKGFNSLPLAKQQNQKCDLAKFPEIKRLNKNS